jgi:hypothetical protein
MEYPISDTIMYTSDVVACRVGTPELSAAPDRHGSERT